MSRIYISFVGILMGLADSVPGVSGSTITYILGIYEDFITAIYGITSIHGKSFKKAFIFLIKLMFGWIIGFLASVIILSIVVQNNIYEVTSLFIGLTIASIPLTMQDQFHAFKFSKTLYIILGFVFVLSIFLIGTFLNIESYIATISSPNILIYIYLLVIGFLTAMSFILPGISGSTILLIFGVYYFLLSIVREILTLNFAHVIYLTVFGVGLLLGLVISAKILRNFFNNAKTNIIYFIEGLLLGSLIPIVYAPTTISSELSPLNFNNLSYLFILIGMLILLGLEYIKRFNLKRNGN